MNTSISKLLAFIIVLGNLPTESSSGQGVKLQMERFEQISGKDIINTSKFRVLKYNRTVFALNGTFYLLKDLDSTYEITIKVAYSTLGNNQFNEYPMKVPRTNVCRFMAREYADFQYMWNNVSNLPHVVKGAKEYCPFPKGKYWIKNLVPDASFIPPVVPAGLWRMTWEFQRPRDVVVMQWLFYYRVTKEIQG